MENVGRNFPYFRARGQVEMELVLTVAVETTRLVKAVPKRLNTNHNNFCHLLVTCTGGHFNVFCVWPRFTVKYSLNIKENLQKKILILSLRGAIRDYF